MALLIPIPHILESSLQPFSPLQMKMSNTVLIGAVQRENNYGNGCNQISALGWNPGLEPNFSPAHFTLTSHTCSTDRWDLSTVREPSRQDGILFAYPECSERACQKGCVFPLAVLATRQMGEKLTHAGLMYAPAVLRNNIPCVMIEALCILICCWVSSKQTYMIKLH